MSVQALAVCPQTSTGTCRIAMVTHKTKRYTITPIGLQRVNALVLIAISIVIPLLTADITLSIVLLPLALGLLFAKQLHMTFKNKK